MLHALLLSAALAALGDETPEQLFRRAAYVETQKKDLAEAHRLYDEIASRFPETPTAAQALERVAHVCALEGDDAAAEKAHTGATALRTKLGLPQPAAEPSAGDGDKERADGDGKPGRGREKLREKVGEKVKEKIRERRDKRDDAPPKGPPPDGVPPRGPPPDGPRPPKPPADRPDAGPPNGGPDGAPPKPPEGAPTPKEGGTRKPKLPELPPEVRAQVDAIKAQGKADGMKPDEIRAKVEEFLRAERAKHEGGDGPKPPRPPRKKHGSV